MHDYNERERERQEVVLESMALLVAKPVQKEAVLQVNLHHGDRHRNRNAHSGNAGQESDDQAEAAKELGGDGQICKRSGNAQLIAKHTYRGV